MSPGAARRVLFGLGLTSAGYRRSFRSKRSSMTRTLKERAEHAAAMCDDYGCSTGRHNDEGYPRGYPRIAFLYLCNSRV
jgi:hypothetical protein